MGIIPALCGLFRRLPYPAAQALIGTFGIKPLLYGPFSRRGSVEANLRRILIHTGTPPSPQGISALVAEMTELQTRFQLFLLTVEREIRFAAESVELALLPEVSRLRSGGKGVILATPHFGFLNHAVMALSGSVPWRMVLPRPERMSQFPPAVRDRLLPLGSCAEDCAAALRNNEVVIIVADVNALPGRRRTLFFGAPAPLAYGAARLSLSTGAPILTAFARGVDDGNRCVFQAGTAICPRNGATVRSLNEEIARSLEAAIGRDPGQWLIFYDFWSGEAPDFRYRVG